VDDGRLEMATLGVRGARGLEVALGQGGGTPGQGGSGARAGATSRGRRSGGAGPGVA
jgi:hypothetical protein